MSRDRHSEFPASHLVGVLPMHDFEFCVCHSYFTHGTGRGLQMKNRLGSCGSWHQVKMKYGGKESGIG